MNNKIWLKRIIGSVFGLFVFAVVMLVLTHTAQNSVATTQILPTINPDPVYVECPAGEEREITWKVKEDFSVSGFDLLLVNVSSESQGIFRMKIWNSEKELIFNDSLAVNEIEPGKWTVFPAELSFQEGEEYRIVIEADASDPYFMQVPDGFSTFLLSSFHRYSALTWQTPQSSPFSGSSVLQPDSLLSPIPVRSLH